MVFPSHVLEIHIMKSPLNCICCYLHVDVCFRYCDSNDCIDILSSRWELRKLTLSLSVYLYYMTLSSSAVHLTKVCHGSCTATTTARPSRLQICHYFGTYRWGFGETRLLRLGGKHVTLLLYTNSVLAGNELANKIFPNTAIDLCVS